MKVRTLLTALTVSLTPPLAASATDNVQLETAVANELRVMGITDANVAALSNHELLTLHHILFSERSQSVKRGKALAILDPDRHSIRGLFR